MQWCSELLLQYNTIIIDIAVLWPAAVLLAVHRDQMPPIVDIVDIL